MNVLMIDGLFSKLQKGLKGTLVPWWFWFKPKQVGYHQSKMLAFNSNSLANVIFQELWTVELELEAVSLKTRTEWYFF